MKYSILMPYIKRSKLLYNTLFSFKHWYADRDDWEIIIIEDIKNNDNLDEVIAQYPTLPIVKIAPGIKTYNPAPLYNAASKIAKGSIFVLTNPECFHAVNVLNGLDADFAKSTNIYVICACQNRLHCNYPTTSIDTIGGQFDIWYQHSKRNNRGYHFCSVIAAKKYLEIKGFPEIYKNGFGWEDNEFRDTVIRSVDTVILRDDLIVIHQAHESIYQSMQPNSYWVLYNKNRDLYLSRR